tara:strand:+ start:686 stop:1099 length:414 start_codon:yes stop_codon:yes gene_type:complete
MRWMLLMLVMGCKPAEPATPDYDRCYEEAAQFDNLEETAECCQAAGREDCELGFLAPEALWGPMGQPQLEEAYHFANRCDYWSDRERGYESQHYCEGYCSSCPSYVSYEYDPEGSWEGVDGSESYYFDCFCESGIYK